jgi:superfamily II DNA or RNA helicase
MQEFIVKANRTYCATDEALSLIDNATSFFEEGYFYSPRYRRHVWDGKKHLFRKADRSFPSGLLIRVEEAFRKKGLPYNVAEDFTTGKINGEQCLHGLELRDYQTDAIEKGIQSRYGIFHMATNAGKTAVMAGLAQKVNGKVLILTHRLELLHQTQSRLYEWLGEVVGMIGDASFCDTHRITVAMVPTLTKRMKGETKAAKEMRTTWIQQFDLLMVDECHHMGASTWYDIALRCTAPYRFGFSGTPIRTDNKDLMLEAATGPVIFKTSNKDLIDAGVSVKPIVRFIPINSPVLENDLEWQDAYHNGIIVNTPRNELAMDIASEHAVRGRRVLLLVTSIPHGERLQKMSDERDLGARFIHGSCSSDIRLEAISDFKEGRQLILISSTILDEGVDIPTIDVLIMMGGGKSPIKLLQRIGRGLRWKTSGTLMVYDFLDLMDVDRDPPKRKNQKPKHGFLTMHAIERYNYLKEQAGFEVTVEERSIKSKKEETD